MSHWREPFEKQHDKRAQASLKSAQHQLYHIQWSLPSQVSFGKSLLLTCQILGRLVNTFAADEKYPVVNSDKLPIPIQMQLSYKQKKFSEFFAALLKFKLNFGHLEKKTWPSHLS